MFDNKTYLMFILILCLSFVKIYSYDEKFVVDESQSEIDYKLESESEPKIEQELLKCDYESLNSCDICKNAYDNYNLYPSSNSFVVRGNNINMNFKNIITDPVLLSDIGTTNYQVINNIISDYNPNDDISTKKAFNEILTSAPLKTGCCFRSSTDDNKQRNVLVRIPLNPNENVDPLFKKFDFKFKSLKIPENSCPVNYYGGSNECNTFFDVYCTNLVNEFNKLNLPLDNFTKFAPECACYAPKTDIQNVYPPTTPPACFKTNCDNIIDPIAYIDPISRNNPCDLRVCNNIFNANNIQAGGNVNISAKLESSCGDNLPKPKNTIDNTDTNNTGTNNTGTNNTGTNNTGTNNTGTNNTGTNNTGTNNTGTNNTGTNNTYTNNTGTNNTGTNNTGTTSTNIILIIVIFIIIILFISSIYMVVKRK